MEFSQDCTLCPRHCHADRTHGQVGFCGGSTIPRVARIALHYWEEPVISGESGSGTVFFSGCNLQCCFCQNYPISHEHFGREITVEDLSSAWLNLQAQGAHNINLVTGAHFVPEIAQTIRMARTNGLHIPIVYNSSGYENCSTLSLLDGLVDIYLPDLKFMDSTLASSFLHAADYPRVATSAIREMYRQVGPVKLDHAGMMKSGVMIRHLIMPGCVLNSLNCLEWIRDAFPEGVYVSLMAQYVPCGLAKDSPPLNRSITQVEYETVLNKLFELGLEEGFVQDLESASEQFIPDFDLTGC